MLLEEEEGEKASEAIVPKLLVPQSACSPPSLWLHDRAHGQFDESESAVGVG